MDDKHYRARITKRTDFAPDLWVIRVTIDHGEESRGAENRGPDGHGAEFRFSAGQYATLGVEQNGQRFERAYSIVSSPYEKELEFFFELVPEGETTPPLYLLQPGDHVLLRKVAKGLFTLDTKQPGRTNHLFVSTVTGVAPFVSYVRSLFKDWKEGRFTGDHKLFLLHGASRSWEFGYREELENFAKEVPWLRCAFAMSRPWEDDSWKGEVGRVDDLLRKYSDQWGCSSANSVAYLCGHPGMIEHCTDILKRTGFGRQNLKTEVYWIPPKPAAKQ